MSNRFGKRNPVMIWFLIGLGIFAFIFLVLLVVAWFQIKAKPN